MHMSIDQEGIAKILSISRSTVSRSLSGHPSINPETRARVLAAASEHGYRMREHGRGRPSGQQKVATIGVLIGTESFEHSPHPEAGQEMLAGLSDAASSRDTMLDTHFLSPKAMKHFADPAVRPTGWRNRVWRGVVLVYQHPQELLAKLHADFPVVSLVHQCSAPALDCIDTDPSHGIELILKTLIDAGHRRIGFMTRDYGADVQPPSWSYARFAGFARALALNGLELIQDAVINIFPGKSIETEALADEVLRIREQHGVTAFVCAADHQAFFLIRELGKRSVRVPHDISITGFDGTPVPAGLPTLTTIRSSLREMGVAAFRRVVSRINDPGQPIRHILHHGKLIKGETVSAPHALSVKR